jgi:uncharacterized protein (DUF1697 family)
MTTYIALLRGINIGGRNKIDMKQLKAAFVESGLTDTRTYINMPRLVGQCTGHKTYSDEK